MLRCVIVDDSPRFLEAARALLEREGVAVVGLASTSTEALRRVEELRPDVTLVDIDLGGDSGLELATRLHYDAKAAPSPVILISTHAEDDYADLIAAPPPRSGSSPRPLCPPARSATCSTAAAAVTSWDRSAGLRAGFKRPFSVSRWPPAVH
jgi:CheY-like chemotaxis protein